MSGKDLIQGAVIKIFKGKTDNTLHQLIRYSIVGGLAFIVDFGTLFILTEYFHLHYLISALIAFILGIITNYILSVTWVFRSRSVKNRINEILIFTLIGIVGLGLNELLLWVFTDLVSIYYLISKIMTTVIVFSWNFFARKFLLFNYVSGNE
jgi:putative flippase GtrA